MDRACIVSCIDLFQQLIIHVSYSVYIQLHLDRIGVYMQYIKIKSLLMYTVAISLL